MHLPTFYDFYQKCLIPANSEDSYLSTGHTHWLIALEGQLKEQEKEFYCWKVTIYPSDSEGCFSWNEVLYSSSLHECIHKAFEHAREIEANVKDSQFNFLNRQEKIS
ncbi:hypothetical protein ABE67_12190 [Cytobacillus firmus]|jgi:hypothetical protein|uniref:hypothetical protein n=1 Tax=Cytobacillus TaxID=2675230 RepID=UPI0018CDC078|nr:MULTISPECIES: hypothetical protein [Cytobacillus]MBG9443442.1 hypothetical protein [Cytobacillus firmus]MBG9450067.1 hypothetical protein [Cytobacillus firmus]MBY6050590.1 hypothetical protein [Cytobacillus firmus]MCC3645454.1 hypothetical protein [Cytobacillus oceanisediminis]MCU1804724.1 hypothetical protein [Cytobacillus firmus]